MMNDSYLTSMFYRPQCIMRSVVLFLKQKVLGSNNIYTCKPAMGNMTPSEQR